ncbi:MAG TPA: hypothetical protein VEV38_11710 [Candidatus Eremiobacteraceae bacterium]|nr:hypothetical protein [Candidatus Eremiobacteraceae bacterium]
MRLTRIGTVAVLTAAALLAFLGAPKARAAIEGAMSCALSTPCLEWDNTSGGIAIKGVSAKGNALDGQTKYKSAGKTAGKAGVLGEDLSSSGNLDSGVLGVSTNGAGVTGTSTLYNAVQGFASGGASGVYGQNEWPSGFGVAGRDVSTTHDNNGAGVLADGGSADDGLHAFASGASANAIYAYSQSASAMVLNQGPANGSPLLIVEGGADPSGLLIEGTGRSGEVFGLDKDGNATLSGTLNVSQVDDTAGAVISSPSNNTTALTLRSSTSGLGDSILDIRNSTDTPVFDAADDGNLYIDGQIFTHGSCGSGCMVGNRRVRSVDAYASMEAEPTIEDNGEAQLVNGVAAVALDPQFANAIDQTAEYLVSVTPEGDCEGLFVASRGPNGFTVRELRHGRHDVAFEYRIVAKRFGVDAPRLPMSDVQSSRDGRAKARPLHHP